MARWHFHTAIHLPKMVLLLHKTALVNFPMATTVYLGVVGELLFLSFLHFKGTMISFSIGVSYIKVELFHICCFLMIHGILHGQQHKILCKILKQVYKIEQYNNVTVVIFCYSICDYR